jgi:hypothetical protein
MKIAKASQQQQTKQSEQDHYPALLMRQEHSS